MISGTAHPSHPPDRDWRSRALLQSRMGRLAVSEGARRYRNRRRLQTPSCRLLDRVAFDPAKLRVDFAGAAADVEAGQLLPRHYTLTHSDVTGELFLTIGRARNGAQLRNWYTRLLRDEVVAEWRGHGPHRSLHVHCHVSGGHWLMAPPALRNWIFMREMPLVLQAFRHGDQELLSQNRDLDMATVWVHYHSDQVRFNRADCWGPLALAASSLNTPSLRLLDISESLAAFVEDELTSAVQTGISPKRSQRASEPSAQPTSGTLSSLQRAA